MRQKTLDGFDFEIISTLKEIEAPGSKERFDWRKVCIHPRTKQGISLSAYFSYYLTNGFTPEEVVDNLKWTAQKRGLILPYELERRLDIHMTARPGERKTYIQPFKKQIMKQIKVLV